MVSTTKISPITVIISGRRSRSHSQRTYFIRMSGGQADIGSLSQWTVRISGDYNLLSAIQLMCQLSQFYNLTGSCQS